MLTNEFFLEKIQESLKNISDVKLVVAGFSLRKITQLKSCGYLEEKLNIRPKGGEKYSKVGC